MPFSRVPTLGRSSSLALRPARWEQGADILTCAANELLIMQTLLRRRVQPTTAGSAALGCSSNCLRGPPGKRWVRGIHSTSAARFSRHPAAAPPA